MPVKMCFILMGNSVYPPIFKKILWCCRWCCQPDMKIAVYKKHLAAFDIIGLWFNFKAVEAERPHIIFNGNFWLNMKRLTGFDHPGGGDKYGRQARTSC